jgi:hypothetical protein
VIWERNPDTCASAAEAVGALGIVTDVRDSEQGTDAAGGWYHHPQTCQRKVGPS